MLPPLQKRFVSVIMWIGIKTWDEVKSYNIMLLAYLYNHLV